MLKSNHPKHCLKNIPFSLCMIAEKISLREIELKELETRLLEQHYPERTIKVGKKKALKIVQNELRNEKEQEKRRSYLLFQPLIQTTPKSCLLLNKPRKT